MDKRVTGNWSWKKFWTVVGIVAIAAIAIAATILTCGAAAAGAGVIAGFYLGATAATIATAGTYVVAGIAIAGIATFALAESMSVYTGNNFMSFMGSAYEPVKTALYIVPALFGIMSQYAPESYYQEKADAKLQKIIDNPKSVQKYSQKEFQKIANRSSWNSGISANGKGYRAYKGNYN